MEPTPPRPRPSIRLSTEEAWAMLSNAHTGIFTSLRRDGTPISLPVWFIAVDGAVWLSTPSKAKKVARVRNNPRTSFLVETGEMWAELKAVHLACTASVVEEQAAWIDAEKAKKYGSYRTARTDLPAQTRQYYEDTRVAIRLDPDERILSWDNSRIPVTGGGADDRS